MFFAALLLILAFVAYLYVHEWIVTSRIGSKDLRKQLATISKHISFNEWDEAMALLSPLSGSKKARKTVALFEVKVLQGTKKYEEALVKARQSAREYPEELLFRLEEGKILLKLEKPESALEALLVSSPILRSMSDQGLLAMAYFQCGFADKCLEILEPILSACQDGALFALAADAYLQKKQYKEAIRLYTFSIEKGPYTPQAFFGLATAYRRLGNLGEAEKIFRRLIENDPENPELILGLGACLQERGLFHKALLIYQTSKAWETKNFKLLKEAAYCALYSKKYAYAESYFFEVIQHEEPNLDTLRCFGFALECQKKWQEAEQVYLRLVQLFPSSPVGFLALAWLFGVGLSTTLTQQQAINFAHVALNIKNDFKSWEILSACESRIGNFERAYQIQQSLSLYDEDKESKMRRQSALRSLRKQIPLGDTHVLKSQVA